MNLYKTNRVLHRDLGYFFVGMVIIYSLSGIALNHIKDWNPNWVVTQKEFEVQKIYERENVDMDFIQSILNLVDEEYNYKNHFFLNNELLRIFLKDGNITIDLPNGKAILETSKRRKIFYEVNFLHYNPGRLWMWFSDIFSVVLIFLAIGGLFMVKGKKGFKWRGLLLMSIGIIIPILFLYYYL